MISGENLMLAFLLRTDWNITEMCFVDNIKIKLLPF